MTTLKHRPGAAGGASRSKSMTDIFVFCSVESTLPVSYRVEVDPTRRPSAGTGTLAPRRLGVPGGDTLLGWFGHG